MEHPDAVRDILDHGKVMGDEEVGRAGLLLDILHQVDHLRLNGHIQCRDALIGNDELGILSVFTFACCINYILAVLAIIFGIVQMVKNEKKGLAIGGIITAVISIVLGIAVSLYAVNIAEKMQDPDSPFYQYFEEYEQKLEEGKSSF